MRLRRTVSRSILACCSVCCLTPLALTARAQEAARPKAETVPIIAEAARILPVPATHGMAVAQDRRAAEVAVDVMRRGGNAIDGAVALGFALAVTFPRAGNLGGGGFLVAHLAQGAAGQSQNVTLDFRERAPAASRPDMFLNAQGEADPKRSREGALAVGVPGSVAGLAAAHAKWGSGRLSLAELIAPAIALARDGLIVADDLADSLPRAAARLGRYDASRAIYFRPDGRVLQPGDLFVQKDLAATLERIARAGPKGFYEGETAQKIAAAIQAEGGVLTAEDLAAYVPVERAPLKGAYRGREIIAMAPPSSGGVLLIELLNILENFDLRAMGAGGANATHVMAEAMKAAFADRVEWLGDPDFAPAAPKGLLSKAYARNIADEIIMDRARPAREVRARDPAPYESDQTTHYSVVDSLGNAVAVTTTLNFSYGNGMVAAGTGVLLNNEMDDFAAKAGASNAFGLVGGAHNLPAPGKRPLSSMTPTIVLKDGKPEIVTGSPGGPRIITTVLETIVNILDFEMNAAEAMIQPRFHHQWSPDELRIEGGFSPDTLALLRAKGHSLRRLETMGSVATIVSRDGLLTGASDTRQRGTGAVGY